MYAVLFDSVNKKILFLISNAVEAQPKPNRDIRTFLPKEKEKREKIEGPPATAAPNPTVENESGRIRRTKYLSESSTCPPLASVGNFLWGSEVLLFRVEILVRLILAEKREIKPEELASYVGQ